MTAAEYRRERRRRGYQSEVAAALGIRPWTISRRERGVVPVSREAALALLSLPLKEGAQ